MTKYKEIEKIVYELDAEDLQETCLGLAKQIDNLSRKQDESDKLKKAMDKTSTRINNGDRWIVFDDKLWFVYEQKYKQKVKKILETENLDEALALLPNNIYDNYFK